MSEESDFKPTWLMIKQHSLTGLKYFCKSVLSEEKSKKYLGSGKVWTLHIKKHGKEYVNTIWMKLFTDKKECENFAINFSKQNLIIQSQLWANLVLENGIGGGSGFNISEEHKQKISLSKKGMIFSEKHKQSLRDADRKKPIKSETRSINLSKCLKGRKLSVEHKEKLRQIKLNMGGKNKNYPKIRKSRDVYLISQMDKFGNIVKNATVKEFVDLEFTKSGINECCNGKRKFHKNYMWKKIGKTSPSESHKI
jgi:hypothetical protein